MGLDDVSNSGLTDTPDIDLFYIDGFVELSIPTCRGDNMVKGQILQYPDFMISASGVYTFAHERSSNLVIRSATGFTWHAFSDPNVDNTVDRQGDCLSFESNGNLVMYSSNPSFGPNGGPPVVWQSNTTDTGAETLKVGDDGVLRLLDQTQTVVWQSH